MDFSSEADLYHRIYPALRVKVRDLKKQHITNIQEKDLWQYLKVEKWSHEAGLTLASMVHDVLNVNLNLLLQYVKKEK